MLLIVKCFCDKNSIAISLSAISCKAQLLQMILIANLDKRDKTTNYQKTVL